VIDYYHTTQLSKEDVERILDDYYEERGWDKESSIPTPDKLKRLELDSFNFDTKESYVQSYPLISW
jgi:aldehyde:ferredoxin oxidoreductase